jgi:putative restriction endonuclease
VETEGTPKAVEEERLSPRELVEVVVSSVVGGGLAVIEGPSRYQSPFDLDVLDGEDPIRLLIYVRNVTHGGRTRRRDEFRIQITDDAIEVPADRLTLLLGYHSATGVFVAFDPTEHQAYGASPSVQIPRSDLEAAAENGIHPFHRPRRDHREPVVAVAADFLADHIRSLGRLQELAGPQLADPERDAALVGMLEQLTPVEEGADTERRRALHQTAAFVRERRFARLVLNAYGGRCAFCGINARLVDGAHIVPVAAGGLDTVRNGIAACPTHHRAFDDHLIEVSDGYAIVVNRELLALRGATDEDREALLHRVAETIRLPVSEGLRPAPDLLLERQRLWTGMRDGAGQGT